MLYLVECDFTDPALEADWNAFYSVEKLRALLSVNGFLTSQRFRCIHGDGPKYLAVHSIAHGHVLDTEEYRHKGGGNFGAWQPYIENWKRGVFSGMVRAPAVSNGQLLILGTSVPIDDQLDKYTLLKSLTTDIPGNSPSRWLRVIEGGFRGDIVKQFGDDCVYQPITECQTSDNLV